MVIQINFSRLVRIKLSFIRIKSADDVLKNISARLVLPNWVLSELSLA